MSDLICDNCRRAAFPRTFRVALVADGVSVGERKLCRACLTHATDSMTKPAPWLDPPTRVKV